VLMARRLGDRVTTWAMFNEPQVHAIMGHGLGEHAPGLRGREPMAAAGHHQNLAQGRALAALRTEAGSRLKLGTVMSLQPVRPAQNLATNKPAAEIWDAAWNRAYLDPLFRATYPATYLPLVEKLIHPGDMEQIKQKIDFLGVNYYSPMYQRIDPNGLIGTNWGALPAGMQTTAMTWGVDPVGLTDILGELRDHYGNPCLYITENGAFFTEAPDATGRINDGQRISYLRDHIAAAHRAIAAGVNLGGYFIWTLVDNWEWAHGFTATFGLARLDRTTLARMPKASFDWFARIARANAA
jgi:beta-glucosidase